MKIRHLDLFSGIGGFSLAARWCGFETIGFSEIDPYCRRVLEKNFPGVPNYGDIKKYQDWPEMQVDIITGGFPCQPFSCAGKRRGAADDRALWPYMFAVVSRYKPEWVVGENVAGIINMELDRVLSDLESIDYTCQAFVIPACAVDARHRRDRVWIVANSEHAKRRTKYQEHADSHRRNGLGRCCPSCGESLECIAAYDDGTQDYRCKKHGVVSGDMSNSNQSGLQGRRCAQLSECGGERSAGAGNSRFEQPANWFPEPGLGGTLDGFSAWLDANRGLTMQSHKLLLAYGASTKARPDQILSILRGEIDQEDLRESLGGSWGISPKEVLFAYLCQLEKEAISLGDSSLAGQEVSREQVRSMRSNNKSSGTSHRSRSKKQQGVKYPDSLHSLSSLLALHAEQAWGDYRYKNAHSVLNRWSLGWEDGFRRVAIGIPNRVDRLRCLGNAIVPQVAYQIMKCISRCCCG